MWALALAQLPTLIRTGSDCRVVGSGNAVRRAGDLPIDLRIFVLLVALILDAELFIEALLIPATHACARLIRPPCVHAWPSNRGHILKRTTSS